MNDPTPSSSSNAVVCPACDAECPRVAKVCWLCNARLNGSAVTTNVVSMSSSGSAASNADQVGMMLTAFVMCVVVVGVFAAAPGLGVVLGIIVTLAMIALGKGSNAGASIVADSKAIKNTDLKLAGHSETNGQKTNRLNTTLKIVVVVLSSALAALLTVIVITIMSIIAIISAFVSFCESCFELLQSQ